MMEMRDGSIDVSNLRRASRERAEKFKRATLKAGDLLISKDGTIGRVAIVPPEFEGGNITQHLVRAAIHEFMNRDYVAQAIKAPAAQDWLTSEKLGVALQGVNVEDFRRLPIAIPPLPEPHEIVRRVEALFRLADAIEKRVAAATSRADKLTQAILAKAFRGELVPTEAELARSQMRLHPGRPRRQQRRASRVHPGLRPRRPLAVQHAGAVRQAAAANPVPTAGRRAASQSGARPPLGRRRGRSGRRCAGRRTRPGGRRRRRTTNWRRPG
jgi:type I restriction enzyme S subunit